MQGATSLATQKEETYSSNNSSPLETPTFRTPQSASKEHYQRPYPHRSHSSDRQAPVHPQVQYLSSLESTSLSRDSRITLPDEARHYIANMADSPAGSPRTGTFNSKPATHSDNASLASQVKSEFLDLEEEDEESDDGKGEGEGEFADNSAGA